MIETLGQPAMAKAKGRPRRSERDDVTVKMNRVIVGRAKLVAQHRGVPVAELLSELVEGPLDRAYLELVKRLEGKG